MQHHPLYPHQPFQKPEDGEISFFEEAFDTDSLKKFFHEQDLSIDTPSTELVNTRSFSEPQSSTYGSTSLFESPAILYNRPIYEKVPNHTGLDATLFKSQDLFGIELHEMTGNEETSEVGKLHRVASVGQKTEGDRMEIVKGSNRFTINVAGKGFNTEQTVKMTEEEKMDYRQAGSKKTSFSRTDEDDEEAELRKSFAKKLVFTIEKSVRPKVIEKKEKVKISVPILVKKESESGEMKVQRKNSTKTQKKESLDEIKIERKVSKDETAISTKKKGDKQKSKQKDEES